MQTLTNCWPSGGETEKCNVNWKQRPYAFKAKSSF